MIPFLGGMPNIEEKIYSVTAITRRIKYTLEESFPQVWIEGEVSNYIHHGSGHRYLSLKDDNATIRLTIWRSVGRSLKFEPENGMKVRAFGDISVYEKGGSYQLNVRKLMPAGVGELEVAFRQLHEKLSAEGLFEAERKRVLPPYPKTVGIVTSPTGAAIRDIIQIARRRNRYVRLILYPALVQGKGAAESIAAGIEYFNERDDIDIIIIGRGGGSLEDLWAFNEELPVRAVAASGIPVVSAVGHEIDTTLADLAADLRAPTPSAAAELVVWDRRESVERLKGYLAALAHGLRITLESRQGELRHLVTSPVYRRPEELVREKQQHLDNLIRIFDNAGKNVLDKMRNSLSLNLSRLESLSPLGILRRGYAVLKDLSTGKTIRSVKKLKRDDRIEAVLSDGIATASIRDIKKA